MHETDLEDETTEYVPLWRRPATSKADDREAAFQRYVESTVKYNEAIVAAGGTPWHGDDTDRRRELFMRRYARTNDRIAV
ncbi:hypothetical protein R2361_16000 [Mycobacteroides chelonae]|uniref:hypothetical protein n=1 Tax=Mycobacteroides chelonae TaxID=1774 RepID=UPI0008A8408E|nr:hypothetical protein [Mycobacteroides chelonae]AYM44107.1 hypothetical protein DYE20_23540 [[Mycobacterium] chelonae subsp. gwanakae]MEC4872007.1 hypothetical protein [Mycobacteroides chelonae]OHU15454.1 hypothetical protein BKG75_10090 [Mycobacteroides chelonae]